MPIHAAAARRPPSIVSAQHGCACPTYCPAWCAYFASKAHLDAAGVVHGPHALHLLVHHLREPPAFPSIRKDRASGKTGDRADGARGFSHQLSPRAQQKPRGAAFRAPNLGGGAEGDDGGEHVYETDGLRLRGVAGLSLCVSGFVRVAAATNSNS